MALSQAELEQCKYWLGYGNLTAGAIPYFDIAVVFEDVIQKYVDGTWAEGYIRNTILANLTALEIQLQTQVVLQAQATELVGDVKISADNAFRSITRLIDYWVNRLWLTIKVPRRDKDGTNDIVLM